MRVCVHPSTSLDPGPRGVLLASSTCPVPWSEDAKRDNHAACNDRKLARASQDHCWIRLGSAAGCSRQRGAACQARRGDRRTNSYHARERTLCHVMVITSLWELGTIATHIIHVSQLRVSGFLRCSRNQRRRRVRGPTVLDFTTRNHGANRQRSPSRDVLTAKTMR